MIRLLRVEGTGTGRESAALAVGVFIGCLPIYGLHLVVCGAVGTVLRLNRLKMYLAANISNPLMAPAIVFAEIQAGAWLRRGTVHPVSLAAMTRTSPAQFGADLAIGSVAVGAALAALTAVVTLLVVRRRVDDPFLRLTEAASDRYIDGGIVAWEFARGKLRRDPVYKAAACGALLDDRSSRRETAEDSGDRTLLDVGCGSGLALALLAEVRNAARDGAWPTDWPSPSRFDRLIGIETRPRVAALASAALGADAEIIAADARTAHLPRATAILVFDVLHMMGRDEQEALLTSLARALAPSGRLLLREADAADGWRFVAVRIGNRLKALAFGAWRQRFCFRTADEWQACLERHGFQVSRQPMSEGTPFANVLLVALPVRSRDSGYPSAALEAPAPTPP